MARRDLQREPLVRQKRDAARERIKGAKIEIRSILVRLSTVEQRAFDLPPLIVGADRDDAESDVCRIHPMMRDGGDWIEHRRYAMWKADRSERGFARESAVSLPAPGTV